MKTMLIPVDFTATSDNAVNYAAEWALEYGYERMILLKSTYHTMFDHLIPSIDYVHVSQDYMAREREEAMEKLKRMCQALAAKVAPRIAVSLAVSEVPLVRSVHELIADEKPALVVAGSDHHHYSSNSYVAGNLIEIAKTSSVRVLIVPSHYQYKAVQQVLVPCDFNTMASLSKLTHYQATTSQWYNKKLQVLHVDPKARFLHPDEAFTASVNNLRQYLKDFDYEIQYANNSDIIEGILEFSGREATQLIVALPGKHSFLYRLTHKSISEALYRHAKQPVLILK